MKKSSTSSSFAYSCPTDALDALASRITPVDTEQVDWQQSIGRILAQPITADRDHPACDVSAMDGYAIRLADAKQKTIPVPDEASIGQPIEILPPGFAMRIFTGAPVPTGAEAVVMREQTDEQPDSVHIHEDITIKPGQNIRRQGENITAGQTIIDAGAIIDPPILSAITSFGVAKPKVYRTLRVGIITTGDELYEPTDTVQPWQLRDSNGPALTAFLANRPYLTITQHLRVKDDLQTLTKALETCLADCDAILLTGGVSMGDHDHVPAAVKQVGCEQVFHKLPIRPGKPLLTAIGPKDQLVMGLPGNPVAVMIGAKRYVLPALNQLAGVTAFNPPAPMVHIDNADDKTLKLWWYRGVKWVREGHVNLVSSMGSGDLVAAARCDGFVEIPPHQTADVAVPFYTWR